MNEIETVIDVFEKQIQALYTNDFEKFLSFMSPRIKNELTIDIFQKAIYLFKRVPIDREAVDIYNSRLFNDGESEEIPDKHVRLVLTGSGRTLCHVVNLNGIWLIDDIYWRIDESTIHPDESDEDTVCEPSDQDKEGRVIKTKSSVQEDEEETIEETPEDIVKEEENVTTEANEEEEPADE